MARRWQLIDENGCREVIVDHERGAVDSGVKVRYDRREWPSFTQLAIRASIDELVAGLRSVADEFDLPCRRVTEGTDAMHAVVFASDGQLTRAAEPGIPFDDRFLTAASSEALVETLETDAVHFGHDPAAGSLHLTKYSEGSPDFTWCDSLEPGPSFALTFHEDGRCTEQDARVFAVDRLYGEAEVRCLNRTRFVECELADMGIDRLEPELEGFATQPGFVIDTDARRSPAGG